MHGRSYGHRRKGFLPSLPKPLYLLGLFGALSPNTSEKHGFLETSENQTS